LPRASGAGTPGRVQRRGFDLIREVRGRARFFPTAGRCGSRGRPRYS
jgi:hypothetical protein